MNNTLDKARGEVEEVAGKATHNDKLEAKGKIRQKAAEVKQGASDVVEDAEQKTASTGNKVMDKINLSNK